MEVLYVMPDYYAGEPRACMDGWGRRFLHVSSCFRRKGIDVLLAAWGRAFTDAGVGDSRPVRRLAEPDRLMLQQSAGANLEQRSIWNQAWFSTQRCANGLYRYAKRMNDKDLERRAAACIRRE